MTEKKLECIGNKFLKRQEKLETRISDLKKKHEAGYCLLQMPYGTDLRFAKGKTVYNYEAGRELGYLQGKLAGIDMVLSEIEKINMDNKVQTEGKFGRKKETGYFLLYKGIHEKAYEIIYYYNTRDEVFSGMHKWWMLHNYNSPYQRLWECNKEKKREIKEQIVTEKDLSDNEIDVIQIENVDYGSHVGFYYIVEVLVDSGTNELLLATQDIADWVQMKRAIIDNLKGTIDTDDKDTLSDTAVKNYIQTLNARWESLMLDEYKNLQEKFKREDSPEKYENYSLQLDCVEEELDHLYIVKLE